MPSKTSTLIRGGTVLTMEPGADALRGHDVLIDGSTIVQVGGRIDPPEGAAVIDAEGRIVLPGFIDTHRHMWEAVLRGVAPAHTLEDYFTHVLGKLGPALSPDELHVSELLSARAALESGVTTVQDISNIQDTPEHTDALVSALKESGLRAVFSYGKSMPHMYREGSMRLPDDVRRVRAELLPDDGARVTMSLVTEVGDDDVERAHTALARELGVLTTRHVGSYVSISRLRELGSLLPGTTFIHGNGIPRDELEMMIDAGASLSVSPLVEMTMGHGMPMLAAAPRDLLLTISTDVEATVASDMFSQLKAAYASQRMRWLDQDDHAAGVDRSPRDLVEAATLSGARSLGLDDRTGSLSPGKDADVLVLRCDRVDAAPVYDPWSTIVTQLDRSHVDTVMVGGTLVRRDGRSLVDDAPLVARASAMLSDSWATTWCAWSPDVAPDGRHPGKGRPEGSVVSPAGRPQDPLASREDQALGTRSARRP